MIELVKAWKVGWKYFLDHAKAKAYADGLAQRYSKNRLDAFEPKPVPMARLDNGSKVIYMCLTPLEKNHSVIE